MPGGVGGARSGILTAPIPIVVNFRVLADSLRLGTPHQRGLLCSGNGKSD